MMPRANGLEALEAMRRRRPELPAIVRSGYDGQVVLRSTESFAFIRKPFSLDTLVRQVAESCVKAEARRGGTN